MNGPELNTRILKKGSPGRIKIKFSWSFGFEFKMDLNSRRLSSFFINHFSEIILQVDNHSQNPSLMANLGFTCQMMNLALNLGIQPAIS